MNEDDQKNEEYVYLEFNGKLLSDGLSDKTFIRVANLDGANPLVQVNDKLFKGKYDYSMGTNMFFEVLTTEPSVSTSPFDGTGSIKLQHLVSQTKVISLNQMRIPPRKINVPDGHQKINYNWDWDYKELLKKFEQGALTLEDIVKSDEAVVQNESLSTGVEDEVNKKDEDMETESQMQVIASSSQDKDFERVERLEPHKILEETYQKLQQLARQPTRRERSPERVVQCSEDLKQEFEYKNIERQILQPSYNHEIKNPKHVDEKTLSDCINIDRCVLYGIIPPSDERPRVLTKEEKEALLTLDNFENLSLPARHHVLKNQLECLELQVTGMQQKQLKTKDHFGRTPVETLEIYRKLLRAVEGRLEEISVALETDQ